VTDQSVAARFRRALDFGHFQCLLMPFVGQPIVANGTYFVLDKIDMAR
jgi:hypothetical protein